MTTTVQFPEVEARVRTAVNDVIRVMEGCATDSYPEWLSLLSLHLLRSRVGVGNENAAAATFALDLSRACAASFDATRARDLFLIKRLKDGSKSGLELLRKKPLDTAWWRTIETATIRIIKLIEWRVHGCVRLELIDADIDAAACAISIAAMTAADKVHGTVDIATHAAGSAATQVAVAAGTAASSRADAPRCVTNIVAGAAGAASVAADASGYAPGYAAHDCNAIVAANAAARADLIEAIIESRPTCRRAGQ